jgi:hypothetical protein
VFFTRKQALVAKKIKPNAYLMMNHHSIYIALQQYAMPAAAAFHISVCFSFMQYFCVVYLTTLTEGPQQKE